MQDKDFFWFMSNYKQLSHDYLNKYIAIKEQKVLGVYSSYAEGVSKTALTEPLGTFIVQHCNGDESGYTNYISSTLVML